MNFQLKNIQNNSRTRALLYIVLLGSKMCEMLYARARKAPPELSFLISCVMNFVLHFFVDLCCVTFSSSFIIFGGSLLCDLWFQSEIQLSNVSGTDVTISDA